MYEFIFIDELSCEPMTCEFLSSFKFHNGRANASYDFFGFHLGNRNFRVSLSDMNHYFSFKASPHHCSDPLFNEYEFWFEITREKCRRFLPQDATSVRFWDPTL